MAKEQHLQALKKILQLEKPWSEANKKLVGCYMLVNGTLEYIKEHVEGKIITWNKKTDETKAIDVKTLTVFLPETGIYPLPNGNWAMVSKIAKRQWLRSYSDSYYRINWKGQKKYTSEINWLELISKSKRCDFYITPEQDIIYLENHIGYIKNSTSFVCNNSLFIQELKEWFANKF